MTTKAKPGKGTLLKIGDGGGTEVFTTIGEVTNIKAPGVTMDTIDVTSMDSTAKEFIASGLPDAGELTFDMNYIGDSAEQQQLYEDASAGATRNFELHLNNAVTSVKTKYAFAGIITNFDGPTAALSDALKASVTVKVTGLPTVTYAS